MADTSKIVEELKSRALQLGFEAFGIASADSRPDLPAKLRIALEKGWHGDMEWMAETEERRADPTKLWDGARSVILLGVNYGPDFNPLDLLKEKQIGRSRPMRGTAIITTSSRASSKNWRDFWRDAQALM